MKRFQVFYIAALMLLSLTSAAGASVELHTEKTLKIGEYPLDVATSADGSMTFVLTKGGNVLIYSAEGTLKDKISVGKSFDGIDVSPRGDRMFLKSGKDKSVHIVSLDFIHNINISGSPYKGPSDAPVVITVFSDFQCPYCARLAPLLDQVLERYPKKVKLVHKHFPLRIHKFARMAAIASMAAHAQGKFWQFYDKAFENYNRLNEKLIQEIALEIGLDMDRFEKDLKNPKVVTLIDRDTQNGADAEVRGTPTVFVNGRLLKERSLQGFKTIIEMELNKRKNDS